MRAWARAPPRGLGAGAGAEGVDGGRAHHQALGVEGGDAEAADDLGETSGRSKTHRPCPPAVRDRAGGDLAAERATSPVVTARKQAVPGFD